jgi:hypothetical protein
MARNELRFSKIEERYTGPFKVKERCANGSYMLARKDAQTDPIC